MNGVFATVQVRMGSSRLPGKVMREVSGIPLLGHLLNRLSLSKTLNGIVVATSVNVENDIIENYCHSRGTLCFRGSEDDVLGRMVGAVQGVEAEIGVEIFGDCPLIDPAIVDDLVQRFVDAKGTLDFLGNDLKTTYPPGMEVEVFAVAALVDAATRTKDPAIREHGTLFIRQNPGIYKILNVEAPRAHFRPDLSMEVDTDVDFDVVANVIENFGSRLDFSLSEVIAFLDANPTFVDRTRQVPRRWKQFREDGKNG